MARRYNSAQHNSRYVPAGCPSHLEFLEGCDPLWRVSWPHPDTSQVQLSENKNTRDEDPLEMDCKGVRSGWAAHSIQAIHTFGKTVSVQEVGCCKPSTCLEAIMGTYLLKQVNICNWRLYGEASGKSCLEASTKLCRLLVLRSVPF